MTSTILWTLFLFLFLGGMGFCEWRRAYHIRKRDEALMQLMEIGRFKEEGE